MSNRFKLGSLAAALLALAGVVSLTGCVVTPVGPGADVYAGPTYGPPAPAADVVVGVAPAPGYIWTGGYWGWFGGRYVWTSGRWIAPRHGYYWARAHWARGPGGWRFVAGHWRR